MTTFEKVLLEKVKYGVVTRLAGRFAIAAKFDASEHANFAEDELVLRVTQGILCQKIETVEQKWPADWWQATKERFAPAWALRRWPVKYKHVALEAKALYPQIALPDKEHYLHIVKKGPAVLDGDDYLKPSW